MKPRVASLAAAWALIVSLTTAVHAAELPTVGDTAQNFTLNGLDAKPVTLYELTAKSPVALIVLRGYPGYQ